MTNLSLPIWTVHLAFSEEINLVSPLLIPEALTANESPATLAKTLVNRLEENNTKHGEYLQMLQYAPTLSLLGSQITVSIASPRKQSLYPDLALAFDYFYTKLPNQHYLGFIPVLGIEGYADTPEELITVLQRAIELEFARKKRYSSVRRLITTQWYKEIKVEKHIVETRFHSLSELANLHKGDEQKWLEEMAQPLKRVSQCHCFGRQNELEQMRRALIGKYSRNLLLVGRAGVGKTALVKELYRVGTARGIGSIKFWETTAARMLQKLTVETGWEESLGQVLEELSQRGDILYVRNLAQLFEVGAYVGNPISMAEFMRTHLALGSVRLITECTDEEFANIETRAPGYTNLFQVVRVEPPPLIQQPDIVRRRLRVSHPGQVIPKSAISETLQLQHRYALYSGFPGKTIHFLESLLNQDDIKKTALDREAVVLLFCEESGMPRFLVDSHTTLKLDDARSFFQSRLFGQDAAIDIVVNLLASVKTRLTRPGKPIASLLFVGPTGVGKTELAKALALFMFGDSERLIRFDMSEFSDEIAVLRLAGDVSTSGQGLLTDKVRQQPFSVILFDELEKAHFSFYDLLLQIMGSGRLTDAKGQVADFCSSVIIMTSNIGAGVSRQRSPGFHNRSHNHQTLVKHYLHAVQQFFRPELFNRLDQVVPFNALSLKVLRPIVRRELDKIIARNGLRTRDVNLQIEEAVIDYLANISRDSHYGARQLQRCLHEQVVVELATTLNRYSFATSITITISKGKNGLEFKTTIHTQKSRADQTLANSKWTLRELISAATTARRLAQQIDDGPLMNKLWSNWDILERNRCMSGENFWQEPVTALEYGILHNLLEEAKTLLQQIETIEIDCSLALLGIKSLTTSFTTALFDWQMAYNRWQVQLLDTVQPETGLCTLSVYGAPDYLNDIYNIFQSLAKNHAWITIERTVWIKKSSDKYIYTEKTLPKQTKNLLIGYETQIIGPGVALYFAKEGGMHIWVDRYEKEHPYAVLVAQCAMNKFQTPHGVHRKKFLESLEKRREYWKNGFFDLVDRTTHTGGAWHSMLEKQLDDNFNERLRGVLCGDTSEIELAKELEDDFLSEDDLDLPF
jgi:ATP-dependent Clp protease ATP-binding subunit ClpA